jgi:calcium binding protein 39
MDAPLYMSTMIEYANYVAQNYSQIMMPIIQGHDCGKGHSSTPDVALHCGTMLRSTLRHAVLYQMLVSSEYAPQFVYPFLDTFAHLPNFEVASDALETLRQILTGGISGADGMDPNDPVAAEISAIASDFLARSYVELIEERFNGKMLSEKANYINRRVALQLLSTILLSRTNYEIMIRYISSRQNLVLIMCLLRDSSPHITLDAFHVFKIFVANPNKPDDVIKILVNNKVKLCNYLETLHKEREANDDQFRDEKALVIATLHEL